MTAKLKSTSLTAARSAFPLVITKTNLHRIEMARTLVFPLLPIGFAMLFLDVVLQQNYTIAGAILAGSGGALMIAYLLFHLSYDSIRRRRAVSLLSKRPQLNSCDFATKFFPDAPELAAKLRDSLAEYLKLDLGGLLPDDDLNETCDAQTDDPSLVWHLEQEFELGDTFSHHEEFLKIEESIHTFRELLEFVTNHSPNSSRNDKQ